jgi:hypothetical protein
MEKWLVSSRSRWDPVLSSLNHFLLAHDLGFLQADDYRRMESDLDVVLKMLSSLSKKLRGTTAS